MTIEIPDAKAKKNRVLSIRISDEDEARLRAIAEPKKRTKADVAAHLLGWALDEYARTQDAKKKR